MKGRQFQMQELKQWIKKGAYIVSTIADDGTIWVFASDKIPIFDFGNTKIFQAQESGIAQVNGVEKGDEFYFAIHGVKVSKVYDYYYEDETNLIPGRK